jgi:hypothetical protein
LTFIKNNGLEQTKLSANSNKEKSGKDEFEFEPKQNQIINLNQIEKNLNTEKRKGKCINILIFQEFKRMPLKQNDNIGLERSSSILPKSVFKRDSISVLNRNNRLNYHTFNISKKEGFDQANLK